MAGHNKWSKIKRTKGVADSKRNKIYTKILREIHVSARMAGGDPKSNPRLRDAIAEAKANNMPKDNIERAIRKGTGQDEGANYEQITYEGYGPGGVALLIESLTDNRKRTVADVRSVLSKNGGNLGEAGSVAWMFAKKGLITVPKEKASEDELMEIALEAGAEDISDQGDAWEISTPTEAFASVKEALENADLPVMTAEQTQFPSTTVAIAGEDAEQMLKLMDVLEDLDDVQKVHANFDISEEELTRIGA